MVTTQVFLLHTMSYALRHQPLKGLYLTYQLLTTLLVRFPVWVLLSLPRLDDHYPQLIITRVISDYLISVASPLRPRKTWSFKRSVLVRLLRQFAKTVHQ